MRVSIPAFPRRLLPAANSESRPMERSFDDSNIPSTTAPARGGLFARFTPHAYIPVAHGVARVARFWSSGYLAPSDEPPPIIAVSPPQRGSCCLCLCFHETCVNPSETEKARILLAFPRGGQEFEDRSARSRTGRFETSSRALDTGSSHPSPRLCSSQSSGRR